ncbi:MULTISPECIES: hypothetical protein [Chromobacterium]|uniref:hypothetical protein n=1 Tax=Chromobacterium TaxID=535 RepID=UPI0005BDD555|nr:MULTISPECIES: hypothetical protein [Chromobacterium]QOZ85773.1 hypothetical protein DXT74_10825 [Chromobacterium sp. Rain0013]WON83633.1 hypothetical protein OK026_21310 [Chromobacterium haemolyticum]
MALQSRNWHAWLNAMPGHPKSLHVAGDVVVANPGVEAVLTMREPQGINPAILMLDLHLVQKPGMWPQVLAVANARYDRVLPPGAPKYTAVEVLHNNERVAYIEPIPEIV